MREPATGAALATKSEKSSAAWYAISPPAEMPVRWMAYRHSLAHKCTRTVLVSTRLSHCVGCSSRSRQSVALSRRKREATKERSSMHDAKLQPQVESQPAQLS